MKNHIFTLFTLSIILLFAFLIIFLNRDHTIDKNKLIKQYEKTIDSLSILCEIPDTIIILDIPIEKVKSSVFVYHKITDTIIDRIPPYNIILCIEDGIMLKSYSIKRGETIQDAMIQGRCLPFCISH